MPTWPPTNYPYPNSGPDPRTNDTAAADYHAQDHNDINDAMNEVILRYKMDNSVNANGTTYAAVGAAGTITIDLSYGSIWWYTLNGNNANIEFTNEISLTYCNPVTLILGQDSTGGRVVNWSPKTAATDTIMWPNGTAPVVPTTAGSIHVFTFFRFPVGIAPYWFGFMIGENMATA